MAIPLTLYSPTEREEAYIGAPARNGYIVFHPDFRGHGASEGSAAGDYMGSAIPPMC